MNEQTLRIALENALQIEQNPNVGFKIFTELDKAEADPANADPRSVALLEALQAEPELNVLNDKVLMIGKRAHLFAYRDLAFWLVDRAICASSGQAINDLATYFRATEFPCEQGLAFSGLTIEAKCELGQGISILPWGGRTRLARKEGA